MRSSPVSKSLSHAQFHHPCTDSDRGSRSFDSDQFTRGASSVPAQFLCPLVSHLPIEHTLISQSIHNMSPSATTELGPASGPDVQLKPEEKPTHKAPRQHASHEEYQYLDLIRDILEEGEHRPDRYMMPLSCDQCISDIFPEPAPAHTPSSPPINSASASPTSLPENSFYLFSPQNASFSAPSLPNFSGSSPEAPPQLLSPNKASKSGTATAHANISTQSASHTVKLVISVLSTASNGVTSVQSTRTQRLTIPDKV